MQESNDLYSQILNSGPSQGTFFLLLSRMKEEGRCKEVIQQCLKALSIYPKDISLRRLLAEAYLEVGFVGRAEEELDKVISELGNLVSAYKLQAKVLAGQNRSKEASDALKLYLAHQPDDRDALDLLADLETAELKLGPEVTPSVEPVTALEEEEEVLSELATPTLAEIYYRQGQIQEAIGTYEKLLSDNPEDETAMRRLDELRGELHPKTADHEMAKPDLGQKKEKMISILEGWLASVQELSRAG